jgi:hypothetical protein
LIGFAVRFAGHRVFQSIPVFLGAGITRRTASAEVAKLLLCVLSLENGICLIGIRQRLPSYTPRPVHGVCDVNPDSFLRQPSLGEVLNILRVNVSGMIPIYIWFVDWGLAALRSA